MASGSTVVSRADIERAVSRIVDQFHPIRVRLFGSHARGEATAASDVDLLVEMETDQRPVDQAVAIRAAVEFPFAVDLLVRTPGQIDDRLRLGDPFFREVLSTATVLYEADHDGMGREG
jgi:predicted nucleotidyltransferase